MINQQNFNYMYHTAVQNQEAMIVHTPKKKGLQSI